MKKNFKIHCTLTAALALLVFVGCSKKKDQAVATLPPPDAAPSASTTTAPSATAKPFAATDANQAFAEADAALKARAYDRAAQALLAAQAQKNISDQQAQELQRRMIGLQANLANAIAAGDANAKAAADVIRQAHMVH